MACVSKKFDGWAPELTALITGCESAPVPLLIYTLPLEHRWNRVPGVTLLGDAAIEVASPKFRVFVVDIPRPLNHLRRHGCNTRRDEVLWAIRRHREC